MKILFVLALLASSVSAFADNIHVGDWTGIFFTRKNYVGGANFSVSKSGRVTGKGIYFNGAVTRIVGSVQGEGTVHLIETTRTFRRILEGTVSHKGRRLDLKSKGIVLATDYIKPSQGYAGAYRGRDSEGNLAFGFVLPDKGVIVVLSDDSGNLFDIRGMLRGGKNFKLSGQGLSGNGEVRNGKLEGQYGSESGRPSISFSCSKR